MLKVGLAGLRSFSAKKICENWKERFGTREGVYFSVFDVLEANKPFYDENSLEKFVKWCKAGEVVIKLSRKITHEYRFRKGREILKTYVQFCKDNNASLLIQTPPSFDAEKERRMAEKFLKGVDVKIFWEIRGKATKQNIKWIKGIAVLSFDPLRYPHLLDELEEEAYFRLHGLGKRSMYYYKFSDEELEKVGEIAEEFKTSYVIFNNVYMLEDALRFLKIVKRG